MKRERNQVLVYTLGIGALILGLIIVSSCATQYLAANFNYSPSLGETFIFGFYFPFKWLAWSYRYYGFYPDFFADFFLLLGAGIALCFFCFILVKLYFIRRSKAIADLHGSAHWASYDELLKMELLNLDKGVYIGAYKYKGKTYYLRHNGAEHLIAFAPTRSGKGVGLVNPTLLSWDQSALVLDLKGELWELSSAWRKNYANNKVIKFDPSSVDGSSARFNILEEIRVLSKFEIQDTQNIALNLVFEGEDPSKGSTSSNAYFKMEAVSLLTALLIYLNHENLRLKKDPPSLSDLYRCFNDPSEDLATLLEKLISFKAYKKKGADEGFNEALSRAVSNIASSMKKKAAAELSGVIGSASKALNLYIDPVLESNISSSDFKIDDLMNYSTPVTLYIVIPPSQKDRLRPLNNSIINLIFRKLTDKRLNFDDTGRQIKSFKHRLLFMADEFTGVGKLSVVQENLAYMAGYGIKAYLIIQDLQQLYATYGKEESITSNCHVRIAYAPNNVQTAELLSKMSGTTTVIKKSITASGKRMSVMLTNISETHQETSRSLITPDEASRLPAAKKNAAGEIIEAGDMLIFVSGQAAIYGKQILYFQDESFRARAAVTPKVRNSDLLRNTSNTRKRRVQLISLKENIFDKDSEAGEIKQEPSAIRPNSLQALFNKYLEEKSWAFNKGIFDKPELVQDESLEELIDEDMAQEIAN